LNRTHLYRFILPSSIILLLFIVLYLKQTGDIKTVDAQCQISGTSSCIIQRNNKKFSIKLSEKPKIEEEINLQLQYPISFELSKSWVQGVNMYMGRSALVVKNTESNSTTNITKALFFLGSCSEKNMLWQLVTVYKNTNTGQELTLFYNFSTQQ
jgi:hypothetical protein